MAVDTVFTVGHGDRTFAVIEALLEPHGVQTIVDVRSRPSSKYAPDFRKDNLAELCSVAGLGFVWMGDRLGGRPDDPALKDEHDLPDWDRIAATPGFRGAIDELAELARGGTVALLCAEGRPEHCHRALLIAPHLEAAGFSVIHVLPDGSLTRHQSTLFPPGP